LLFPYRNTKIPTQEQIRDSLCKEIVCDDQHMQQCVDGANSICESCNAAMRSLMPGCRPRSAYEMLRLR
jgi:predicted nucleic acid-binding Zn ribbon protein